MENELTIPHTLLVPIDDHNGGKITDLTFTEPDVGQMIDVEETAKGEIDRTMRILAMMCGLPFEIFRKIKGRDITQIITKTEVILGNVK
ncbi:phage tail assembly protein [Ochrobactrum sp. A-1]|uniref:phage tail assembly protein n=1 Tax=Ochrobactrum sp. A-1 TaxID=2920940 RepID=UPI001F0B52E6|nr:phage tail assembly protein [Ochrobactrum sp. A-1]